jgi:hypothetical protein
MLHLQMIFSSICSGVQFEMNFFYLMMPNFSVKNVGFINISTLMISVIEGIRNQITPKFVAEFKSPNHIIIRL